MFEMRNKIMTYIIFIILTVLCYLGLFRLDELGMPHYRKFVRSQDVNKMYRVCCYIYIFVTFNPCVTRLIILLFTTHVPVCFWPTRIILELLSRNFAVIGNSQINHQISKLWLER